MTRHDFDHGFLHFAAAEVVYLFAWAAPYSNELVSLSVFAFNLQCHFFSVCVDGREKPLALYVFSRNQKVVDHVLNKTTSGSVCANDVMIQSTRKSEFWWVLSQPFPCALNLNQNVFKVFLRLFASHPHSYNSDLQTTLWVTQRCFNRFKRFDDQRLRQWNAFVKRSTTVPQTPLHWRRRWSSKRLKRIKHLCVTLSVVCKSLFKCVNLRDKVVSKVKVNSNLHDEKTSRDRTEKFVLPNFFSTVCMHMPAQSIDWRTFVQTSCSPWLCLS